MILRLFWGKREKTNPIDLATFQVENELRNKLPKLAQKQNL